MSKLKSLTPDKIAEMKQMVVEGVQPQKIADHYQIGISTVHNYKKQFKNEGLKFKSVRGRQAADTITPGQVLQTNSTGQRQNNLSLNSGGGITNQHSQVVSGTINSNAVVQQYGSTFMINDVTVQVSSQAKSVQIEKNAEGVVFKVTI